MKKIFAALFILLSFSASLCAQPNSSQKTIEGLVRVSDVDPTIVLDLRYATENNFTNKKVYPASVCVLNQETAKKLAAANAEFKKDGYHIKIWDAYRPPYVQKIFWNLVPDERYVANPNKGGSRHNRGGAVDMTLLDKDGSELLMPTGFDDFTEKASPKSKEMTPSARKNVDYLISVMTKHGFLSYENEWWHFDDSDWRSFLLADVNLEKFLLKDLDSSISQALVVEDITPGGFSAKLTAWEKKGEDWRIVFDSIDAAIGRNGFANKGEKREGDGKTPSGIFHLTESFGYERDILIRLPFRQATKQDFWVDDVESTEYNQWVSGKPNAKSFEALRRGDDLYKYGIVIDYNTNPIVRGKGSAIFLHVWRSAQSATAGCVAVSKGNIVKLLSWLNSSNNPVIILGK